MDAIDPERDHGFVDESALAPNSGKSRASGPHDGHRETSSKTSNIASNKNY